MTWYEEYQAFENVILLLIYYDHEQGNSGKEKTVFLFKEEQ